MKVNVLPLVQAIIPLYVASHKYCHVQSFKLPDDPVKYDFETVHNIDEYGADFDDSVRGSLKTWNMTVQYWLAVNVHRRFPIRALRFVAFDIC